MPPVSAEPRLLGPIEDPPQPLVEHLVELRRRLIVSLLILAAASMAAWSVTGAFLAWLAEPAGGLVFQAPTEAFYTRLRVAVYGGLLLALPLILHQAWLFTARALDGPVRRLLLSLIPVSYALFMLGVVLSLRLVVPAALGFLLSYASDEVRPLLSLGAYLDFVTGLSLAFGAVFQIPVVLYALNRMGLLQKRTLAASRRWVYLLIVAGAALLTPGPDVVSQLLLALPAALLFEASLLAMRP